MDVGIDVFSLATLGAGRIFGPGIKILGKEFGGALGRLTAETKAAGAVARGNAARQPIQAEVNAQVAQARLRLVGGTTRKVERRVYSQVKVIRAQGTIESQQAFNAARDTYVAQKTTTTFAERVALGGGDPELALLRKEGQSAALGFSDTSRVGLAAAKTDAPYARAVAATRASNVAAIFSTGTDTFEVKPYNDWRNNWPTKVKGTL